MKEMDSWKIHLRRASMYIPSLNILPPWFWSFSSARHLGFYREKSLVGGGSFPRSRITRPEAGNGPSHILLSPSRVDSAGGQQEQRVLSV